MPWNVFLMEAGERCVTSLENAGLSSPAAGKIYRRQKVVSRKVTGKYIVFHFPIKYYSNVPFK